MCAGNADVQKWQMWVVLWWGGGSGWGMPTDTQKKENKTSGEWRGYNANDEGESGQTPFKIINHIFHCRKGSGPNVWPFGREGMHTHHLILNYQITLIKILPILVWTLRKAVDFVSTLIQGFFMQDLKSPDLTMSTTVKEVKGSDALVLKHLVV